METKEEGNMTSYSPPTDGNSIDQYASRTSDAINLDLGGGTGDSQDIVEDDAGPRTESKGEGDEPEVLEPDHPLMGRFQAALKIHLQKQIERLSAELFDLSENLKRKQKEREDVGVSLYNLQQEVARQQATLDTYHETLSTVNNARLEEEQQLQITRHSYKEQTYKANEAKRKEDQMRQELEKLSFFEVQFSNWVQEIENELATQQRISEKAKAEKRRLAEEKRQQDLIIHRLTVAGARLRSQILMTDAQICVKREEKLHVLDAVTSATTDLQALSMEEKQLIFAWNGVVLSMKHRDSVYGGFQNELSNLQESYRTLEAEIEGYRRTSSVEMEKNERLTLLLKRSQHDHANTNRQLTQVEEKNSKAQMEWAQFSKMLQETEKDLQKAAVEGTHKENLLKAQQREIEKLSAEKVDIEEEMVRMLQEELTQVNASKYMNRQYREMKKKATELETSLLTVENKVSQITLAIEQQKRTNLRLEEIRAAEKEEVVAMEADVKCKEEELERLKCVIVMKQGSLDNLNKKLAQFFSVTGQLEETPLESKKRDLEKAVEEISNESEKLKQKWLRLQEQLVLLSQKRNTQLREIDILRKEVTILEQKVLKVERTVETHKKEEVKIEKSINEHLRKLTELNQQLYERRGSKEAMDKENTLIQHGFLSVLKEAEMEAVQLQTELEDLQQEKQQLAEELMDVQRESLSWEKKVQMASEAKATALEEKHRTGEVGEMISEIGRMEVRYSQLLRVQDKLVHDLEYCVMRRDTVVYRTEAREKKGIQGIEYTRRNFQKKLEDLRNKIKQMNNETRAQEEKIAQLESKQKELVEQLNEKQQELQNLQEASNDMGEQIEVGLLQRHQNLQAIVRKQSRVKMYQDLKEGRHRVLYRTQSAQQAEIERQKKINSDLGSIIETLTSDFPSLKFQLAKIKVTLCTGVS